MTFLPRESRMFNAPFPAIVATDYGVVGDGATDDSAALAETLALGAARTIIIPSGTYRFGSTLAIAANTDVRLQAGAILQCRVTGGVAGITLGDGASLRGECGPPSCQIIAHASCNLSVLIKNLTQSGAQRYAYLSGLYLSAQTSATMSGALVDMIGLGVPSFIRDCMLICNSVASSAIHSDAGVMVQNCWSTTDGVIANGAAKYEVYGS